MITLISFALFTLVHSQCSIPPLQLAWQNTTVTQDGQGVTRGIAMGIGSPSQLFAMRPSTQLNNTRVNSVADCTPSSNDSCIATNGGVFTSSNSNTFTSVAKDSWNGTSVDNDTGTNVYFNDRVTFQQTGLNGFPLVMDSTSQASFAGLPLGMNSSFLDAVFKGGLSPSKVFGLWSGSRSLAPLDGSLIVGGYDSARVGGKFQSFPITQPSKAMPGPLQVNISRLEFAGYSLLDGDKAVTAMIEPFNQKFTFTPFMAKKFAYVTGQNASGYPGSIAYPANTVPSGDLKITLSNGYTTTIANSELFTLQRGNDANGRYSITNSSVAEAAITDNRNSNDDNTAISLGALFLTFNYLTVDYVQGNFSLAPVSSTTATIAPNVVTMCTSGKSNGTAACDPNDSSCNGQNNAWKTFLPIGIISNVIIAVAIFFVIRCVRKRKQRNAEREIHISPPYAVQHEDDKPRSKNRKSTYVKVQELESYPPSRSISVKERLPDYPTAMHPAYLPPTKEIEELHEHHEMPTEQWAYVHELPGEHGYLEMGQPSPALKKS